MEPSRVMLDAETAAKLAAANNDPVLLCNPVGEVIGYYLTPAQLTSWNRHNEAEQAAFSERIRQLEEQRRNDPRPNIPHEEVLRWVEDQ